MLAGLAFRQASLLCREAFIELALPLHLLGHLLPHTADHRLCAVTSVSLRRSLVGNISRRTSALGTALLVWRATYIFAVLPNSCNVHRSEFSCCTVRPGAAEDAREEGATPGRV